MTTNPQFNNVLERKCMEIPEELKIAIQEQSEGLHVKNVVENSQIISERYRKNDGKGKNLLNKKEEAISYMISRMPATYCAIYTAIQKTMENYEGKLNTSIDIGAGTGSATWALNEIINLEQNTCLEREDVMLELGKQLMTNSSIKATWKKFDILKDELQENADIVITSYMINELPENERKQVIEKIWNITNKVLIIIEPGTPNGFKNILTARNLLIEKGANILAPCVHKGKCEIKEDDWCGFSARVARSGLHRLAKKGELSYEDEKFSYIAFSKDDTNIKGERILRHPQIGKGFIKIKTCSQKGIEEKVITKKQGEIYKKLKKQNAGDLINND